MKGKELENKLRAVYDDIRAHVNEDTLINADLAQPMTCPALFFRGTKNGVKSFSRYMRMHFWPIVLFLFFASLIGEAREKVKCALSFVPLLFIVVKLWNRCPNLYVPYISWLGKEVFLSSSEKKYCDREDLFSSSGVDAENAINNFVDRQDFDLQAVLKGICQLKYRQFDCIGISGLVIWKILQEKIPCRIKRFLKEGGFYISGHSYVTVNLNQNAKENDFETWNNDCYIICPWYGIFMCVEEIKKDKHFFEKYPLLDPSNKRIASYINGDSPPDWFNAVNDMESNNVLLLPSLK